MPWRPPYEDVNATFAPTYNVDDDAVLLSNLLEQLTLADVIQVAAEQSLRSCMLERLPPHLRTSAALKRHWDALLPGRRAVAAADART
ncbi:hypothetical protein JL722_2140 [Aureococcus anophagefferens]|nr:hypothetical protein JL722_2140 [Aureococcus anophagefferens]